MAGRVALADQIVRYRHHVCPVVVTFHAFRFAGGEPFGLGARRIISRYGVHCSRRAAKAAEAVVVVARHLVGALKRRRRSGQIKVRVIPSGIDLSRFKPMDPAACKQKLGWIPHSFHVLFASNNGDGVKRPWLAKRSRCASKRARPQVGTSLPGRHIQHGGASLAKCQRCFAADLNA